MTAKKTQPTSAKAVSAKSTKKNTAPATKENNSAKDIPETAGLTKLGNRTPIRYDKPEASMLEAFNNRYPERDYVILFEHPEFTSLCPMTGQPDFGFITVRYVPDTLCVESKAFKLYMGAFRNHGSFMETIVNTIADDLVGLLKPRRLTVKGAFNLRGGTGITVIADHIDPKLPKEKREYLAGLWSL